MFPFKDGQQLTFLSAYAKWLQNEWEYHLLPAVAHLKDEVRESEELLEEMRSRAPDRKKAVG